MPTTDVQAAATIARHWRDGSKLDALPAGLRPDSLAAGYAVQAVLAEAMNDTVVGWKIAATSVRGQHHIGVDGPIAGRLLASRVMGPGCVVPMQGNRMRVAECEFVFVLGRDLPPREAPYGREEVAAAVAELRPGLELPDSRFEDFVTAGAPQLAADNACAHWMVVGEAVAGEWRTRDLATYPTRLEINSAEVTRGTGADVLGHPLDALAWLANSHPLRGCGLESGQIVTTGVSGAPSAIAPGDDIAAFLGNLGRVRCTVGP